MKLAAVFSTFALVSLASASQALAAPIDDARLLSAHADTANWLTHGRTYAEERFSPLDQVNEKNVANLRLAWTASTESTRGLESVPIVVDGTMYTTAPWSVVFALDAKTGKQLWKFDPKVDKQHGQKACCDVVNRGVAVYDAKVYFGTLDGRLIALDAKKGTVVWETLTVDPKRPHTITAAPRVYDGKVLIGNGGAELGVRGYLSAYDAKSGKLVWRTYTVPGDPAQGYESKAMEAAAKTWKGDFWKVGGGGTAWDSMSYDPELGLVYFGTGNGVEWDHKERSEGSGDNLYTASVLAVEVKTGAYRWHYQHVPGDTWDFDSVNHLPLVDLKIGGKTRKVLLQAHKNGFFYVIDRATGELISADPFVDEVTWASHIDLKTGRPVETEGARYESGLTLIKPSPFGAHNWQPMSFSPQTGLVYIPTNDVQGAFESDPDYEYKPGAWNVALHGNSFGGLNRTMASGTLVGWDPVARKAAWTVDFDHPWNGGTLATAGNLVFQGTADNRFVAYRASDGERLWQTTAGGTGIIAAPMTYTVDGVQYVSVSAGWGGAFALVGGDAARASGAKPGGWVMTWALDEKLPPVKALSGRITRGFNFYHQRCAGCHGSSAISGGLTPDLRQSAVRMKERFVEVTKAGIPGTGMGAFGEQLNAAEIGAIQAYLVQRAEESKVGLE